MNRLQLTANELRNSGFKVSQVGQFIEVTLSNRKPGKMEVEMALEQAFEGIQFDVRSGNNSVEVRL